MLRLFTRNRYTETTAQAAGEARSLANPDSWLLDLFGSSPAAAGVSVTPANAMRCTAVRAGVEAISEAVGGLPLHVYQRGADGARERAADHPAYAILHDQANDWTPASTFREQITRDALLHGNGFAFVNRFDGEPRELIRLRPDAVSVELDPRTSEPLYRISDGATQRIIDRRDILHIAAPSVDGVKGESPVRQCRDAIAVNLAIERQVSAAFASRPSGTLTVPDKADPVVMARMKQAWLKATAEGRVALLEQGTTWNPLTPNLTDSQTLQLWQHSINEIARVFRVPPHMLFELGRATWGNAAEMGATFLRFTLDRWLKAWQGEIRLKLIAADDRSRFYAEFLVDDLLRSDLAARADAYGKLIAARVLNPNEVRAMENRAPYVGGDVFANPNVTTTTTTTGPVQ